MADAYAKRGDTEKAYSTYQKSIDLLKTHYEQDHPKLALTYNCLGALYYTERKYFQAYWAFNNALKIREKTEPKTNSLTAYCFYNISLCNQQIKDLKQAYYYYQKFLAHKRRNLDPEEMEDEVMEIYQNDLQRIIKEVEVRDYKDESMINFVY